MEKRRLLFISSVFLLLTCYCQVVDSVGLKSDTIPQMAIDVSPVEPEIDSTEIELAKRLLVPSLYLDYGKLLTLPVDFETKYEGGIELLFLERFALIGEFGAMTLSPEGAYTNGIYDSDGTYYRIGVGYLGQLDNKHNIGISMRYGSSTFDENVRILVESPSGAQPEPSLIFDRSELSANWWELVLYTDQKLLRNSEIVWIGLNLRFRILQRYDSQEVIDVYAIPGYGRSFDKTIPAANFFIKVRF